jgi:hypothetical protein
MVEDGDRSMRTGIGAVLLGAAAILAAGPGTASPVMAATTTWTVHPGGAVTATAGKTTLTDTKTGTTVSCESSGLSGTLKSGNGLSGAGIGTITAAAFRCSGPIGSATLSPGGLPWHLNLSSFSRGTRTSRGTLSHVELDFSIPEVSPSCSAVVSGTSGTAADGMVTITYSDRGARLNVLPTGGDLHWYHVQHCLGLIGNGDPAALSSVYAVSPAQTVTSP